jgi:hypothetical protein
MGVSQQEAIMSQTDLHDNAFAPSDWALLVAVAAIRGLSFLFITVVVDGAGAVSFAGAALIVAGAFLTSRADRAVAALRLAKAALLIGAVAVARPAAAQQTATSGVTPATVPTERSVAFALPRLTGPIRIDGASDDPAWQVVAPLPMTVYLPSQRDTPVERTLVRVAYDDHALYVMVDAWESHPGQVRASSMIRDDDAAGDFINVLLDTFGDRQSAVNFSTTPGGQRNDWTISNDARDAASLSPAWNGVWDVAVRRGRDGWHAEYRIPFATLRFASLDGPVEFGLSINRLAAHSNERVTFPAIEPNSPLALWKPSHFQRVSVEGIRPGRSARLTPYAAAGLVGGRGPAPASSWSRADRLEFGADYRTALGANLTLDATANTDFAEAEADDQRVNLTRFPLFYPERRAFFVERSHTFGVKTGESDLLFNSRRVGLSPAGEPVRLLGGVRLVGRVAGWDVGIFDAQLARSDSTAAENLGVLRVRRALFNERSWAGAMLTSRLGGDTAQLAMALDGDLNLGGDDYVGFAFVTLAGETGEGVDRGVLPRGAIRVLGERRRNRGVWYRAGVATTGARYAPALGYVERQGAVRPLAEAGYGRVVSRAGHQARAWGRAEAAWRSATGSFESSAAESGVALEQPGGALWTLALERQVDELAAPLLPIPGATVPAGRHTADFVRMAYTPSNGSRAVIGAALRSGEYYDGILHSLQLAPEWRASVYLRFSGEVQVDRLEFASRGERVWSRLVRLRIMASASPRLSLSGVLQANGSADIATANLRLRYNAGEGHDLWIVYNHHANLDRERVTPPLPGTARSALLVKYTRSFGS